MSGFSTFVIREDCLQNWNAAFLQFGLKLEEGLGKHKFPSRPTKKRLFHLLDSQGANLLWLEVQPARKNQSDGVDYSLMRCLLAPRQNDGLRKRRLLAALQLEYLVLASGARKLEKKLTQRFIARSTQTFFNELPELLRSFQNQATSVVLNDNADALMPFAVVKRGLRRITILGGRLIEPVGDLTHYLALVLPVTSLRSGRVKALAAETLAGITSNRNYSDVRVVQSTEASELVR